MSGLLLVAVGLHFDAIDVYAPIDHGRWLFSLAHPPAKLIDLPNGRPVWRGITPRCKQPDIDTPVELLRDEVTRRSDAAPRFVPWNRAALQLLDNPLGDNLENIHRCLLLMICARFRSGGRACCALV